MEILTDLVKKISISEDLDTGALVADKYLIKLALLNLRGS